MVKLSEPPANATTKDVGKTGYYQVTKPNTAGIPILGWGVRNDPMLDVKSHDKGVSMPDVQTSLTRYRTGTIYKS